MGLIESKAKDLFEVGTDFCFSFWHFLMKLDKVIYVYNYDFLFWPTFEGKFDKIRKSVVRPL